VIIAAFDPGPKRTGMSIWDGDRVIFHDTVPNDALLDSLRKPGSGIPPRAIVAVERLHPYGCRVGPETFQTIEFFGAICECLKDFDMVRVYRREVKSHWLGKASGNDADIRRAMYERFGEPGTKKDPGFLYGIKPDALQSLALGIAVHDQLDDDLRMARKPIEGLRLSIKSLCESVT